MELNILRFTVTNRYRFNFAYFNYSFLFY